MWDSRGFRSHDSNRLDDVPNLHIRQQLLIPHDVSENGVATVKDVGVAGRQLALLEEPKYLARGGVIGELLNPKPRSQILISTVTYISRS